MEMNEFIEHVKGAKYGGSTGQLNVKVVTNHEHTNQRIYRDATCERCGHTEHQSINVTFKKPVQLTIFEADLLFMLFYLKRRPLDYANYDECNAGKEFIDNIITVIK